MSDLWDITDQPDYENITRIIGYLSRREDIPGAALDALEGLLKVAYPGEVYTFTCEICGSPVRATRTPGKKPSRYCGSADCAREATRRRVAKYRGGK